MIAILLFILLLDHYPWWVALFNSLALVIVGVLINIAVKKINRNRKRYFYYPSWFSSLTWYLGSIILLIVTHYISLIVSAWIAVFVVFIFSIIFPELPEK